MSCVLRVSGEAFDVDGFLTTCELEPITIFRKGEPRFPASRPEGPHIQSSGVNFEASSADFSELATQIEEATAFVREHSALISMLRKFPGVEDVSLDFGVEIHPPGFSSFTFASKLMLACGTLDISLKLSVYPVEEGCEKESASPN